MSDPDYFNLIKLFYNQKRYYLIEDFNSW